MLQKSKDYWKKKAEQDYEYAEAEQRQTAALIENQNAWKKRYEESSWLLKGAAANETNEPRAFNDQNLLNEIEEKSKKKHKFDLVGVGLEQFLSSPQKKDSKEGGKKSGSPSKSPNKKVRWSQTMGEMADTLNPLKSSTAKTPEEVKREEEARRRVQSDERRQREEFLQKSMDRIRVLERVKTTLERPRMPKHHKSNRLMPGNEFRPPAITLEERLQNLRPEDREIRKIQPILEELKSWDEVIAEDNATKVRQIPGRYHQYLGEDRLYPLNAFPSTIEVLLPLAHTKDMIPENVLLKDIPKPTIKPLIDPNIQRAIQQQKTIRLKSEKIDFSRSPIKHYPITNDPNKYELPPPYLQKQIQEQQRVIHENDYYSNSSSVRVNQQYPYPPMNYPDDNSVHYYPHPNVIFYENELEKIRLQQLQELYLKEQREKAEDSVAGRGGLQYNLLNNQNSLAPSAEASLVGGRLPSLVSQEVSLMANDSQNAIRSNYLAENSIRTEPKVPVKLVRLRNARSLKNVHLKNDLHFISAKQKESLIKRENENRMEKLMLNQTIKEAMNKES